MIDMEERIQLGEREKATLKLAIEYAESIPAWLSRFYDVKTLLYKEILKDPEGYKADSVLNNPLEGNKIKKAMNVLDKKYIRGREIVDCTAEGQVLPSEWKAIAESFSCVENESCTEIKLNRELNADVFLSLPRGNKVTMTGMQITPELSFAVQNPFNAYSGEGFLLAVRTKEWAAAIEPSALAGVKGKGDVFFYLMAENVVYKDQASKYFNVDPILKIYRG